MSDSIDAARKAFNAARETYRQTREKADEFAMLDAFYRWQHLKDETERVLG